MGSVMVRGLTPMHQLASMKACGAIIRSTDMEYISSKTVIDMKVIWRME